MIKNIIPMMYNLARSFKGGATTFTTPYTKNKLDLVVDSIVEFKLIEFKIIEVVLFIISALIKFLKRMKLSLKF